MNKNEVSLYWGNSEIIAEVDEYGDLNKFNARLNKIGASIKKKLPQKKHDRKSFYTTGISQIGTTEPNPPDREDMIKEELRQTPWTKYSWVGYIATILAIAFDWWCFDAMFDDLPIGYWSKLMSAIAAAVAIDVVPMFFAQCLDELEIKRRTVHKWIFGITILLFLSVIFILMVVRFGLFNTAKNGVNEYIILSIVPVITSFSSFVANYISYHPDEDMMKQYKINEMHRMESICELRAMIAEIDADEDYENRLLEENQKNYDIMNKIIDSLAQFQKDSVRVTIAKHLESPADTSDLTYS